MDRFAAQPNNSLSLSLLERWRHKLLGVSPARVSVVQPTDVSDLGAMTIAMAATCGTCQAVYGEPDRQLSPA